MMRHSMCLTCAAVLIATMLIACDDNSSNEGGVPAFDSWQDVQTPDIFNPIERPNEGCGYGYGYGYGGGGDCTGDLPLDCRATGCVRGACVAMGERYVCECEPGYAGELCNSCDEGFVADGTMCVPEMNMMDMDAGDM